MQEAILQMDLILRVNGPLSGYERRKLPSWLDTDATAALADARTQNSAWLFASGDLSGARLRVKEAREKLAGLVRNAHSYIGSLPEEDVSAADQIDALTSLGFEQGGIGQLNDPTHLVTLADQIVRENGNLPAAVRVPVTIVTRLTNWLAVLRANEIVAGGGSRQDLTDDKDDARDRLIQAVAQVRFYIASTDPETDGAAVLALYNFQPRRDPGDAQPQPLPGVPGTAAFDAATRLLSVAALPEHATSLVAWRQAAGGEPESAGISQTTSLSVSDVSPLTPGVVYTVWVTGRNSRGDGLASNMITFTA